MTLGPDSARSSPGRLGRWLGALVALVAVPSLGGCPGTLDQALSAEASGSGGGGATPGSGGSTGTGGGGTFDCTGGNDGATLVTARCAVSGCHVAGVAGAGQSGGLDLTVNAGLASRLVGVTTVGTATNSSKCVGNPEPYLETGVTPAMGLLIEKMTNTPPCGDQMPDFSAQPLSTTQQNCIIQWATTLVSP